MSALTSSTSHSPALRCPHCKIAVERVRRAGWMRALPFSRHLRCLHCEQRYLRFLGWWLGPL